MALAPAPTQMSRRASGRLLLLPAFLALAVFFLVPLGLLIVISFSGPDPLAAYRKFLASAAAMKVLRNTTMISVVVTGSCVLIAVPFCLALQVLPRRLAGMALLATTLPLWISVLVRSYAWIYILAQEGALNAAAQALGLIASPLPMLFNFGSVWIGMVHILLPYMILPVYNAVQTLDPQLARAARSLGAGSWRVFATIVLPLILPGIATGALLVFILALGFYITPQMLGGPRNMMLATYIDVLVNTTLDWPRAAAAAMVLIVGVLLGFGLLSLFVDRRREEPMP